MDQITITHDGRTITLEEGDTLLKVSTGDPEQAQAIYQTIAERVRRMVAMI